MMMLRIFVYVVVVFMMLPIMVIVPISFNDIPRIVFPPTGFSLRWYAALLADAQLMSTVFTSLILALVSTVIAILISLPVVFAVHRGRFRGREVAETLATGPRMVPQVVLALGMLILFEYLGWIQTYTVLFGAHLVMLIPFAFRTLSVSVATLDRRLELSSEVLGASSTRTFFMIVVPQLKTGIIAAAFFGFVLSLNNVTLALFLSGPDTRTFPVELFYRMYISGMNPMVPALSVLLALFGFALFFFIDKVVGVYRVFSQE